MKHFDAEQAARFRRLQIHREERERSRQVVRKAKRLNRLKLLANRRRDAADRGLLFDKDLGRVQLVLPPIVSFTKNFDETANILEALREVCLRQNRRVMLHFTSVEEIEPAAALALVAEIFRIRNLRSVEAITGTYPRLRSIYELLSDMGFFSVLKVQERREPKSEPDPTRAIFLRFLTGNRVESELVDTFVRIIEEELVQLNEVARGRLIAAIIEAMNNTLDHAHPIRIANETMPHRWWMSSAVNIRNQEITVMLFDQGVGIPKTLDPTLYERVRTALKGAITLQGISAQPTDSEMILAATELHRTSTGQSGRGKGFRNMKQFVDVCPDGELRVLSNRGRYCYMKGTEAHDDASCSMGGTLIEWRFRHDGSVELKDD